MDWKYKPERKADFADIAQTIHDTVSMDDVIRVYAPHLPIRNRRCPCPFHNGKDPNFSFTRYGYKCFVCGASGDVIGFVKEVCELSTRPDAMRRMNEDLRLNLPIDGEINYQQSMELAKRRAEAETRLKAQQDWDEEYNHLMFEYARLDKILMKNEDISLCAHARELIGYISYRLDSMPPRPQ